MTCECNIQNHKNPSARKELSNIVENPLPIKWVKDQSSKKSEENYTYLHAIWSRRNQFLHAFFQHLVESGNIESSCNFLFIQICSDIYLIFSKYQKYLMDNLNFWNSLRKILKIESNGMLWILSNLVQKPVFARFLPLFG